ncbi:carboxypeptidase-like regulatory domain-containing protein [Hugenholtzia roseola]|uniref:carboxypeptidase-like regulatory domain-containing protein n=1 Tax=Hugenholtzia roseola TaxID=1002 RepID=UPI0006891189|nr:carboxypeptidase-like regulatory domain-containing protein [Hugenholtzia roseola]
MKNFLFSKCSSLALWGAVCFLLLALSLTTESRAQGERQVVRFSGILVEGDSAYGVPYAHILIPRAGVGTTSNGAGYFTINALEGDTVHITSMGLEPVRIIIPRRGEPSYSIFINMQQKDNLLDEVIIYPFDNAYEFKEAILALQLEDPRLTAMRENLSQERIYNMALETPMSAEGNYRMMMNNQIYGINNRFFVPTLQLLNPFAWAKFIESIRNKDYKKKLSPTEGSRR